MLKSLVKITWKFCQLYVVQYTTNAVFFSNLKISKTVNEKNVSVYVNLRRLLPDMDKVRPTEEYTIVGFVNAYPLDSDLVLTVIHSSHNWGLDHNESIHNSSSRSVLLI